MKHLFAVLVALIPCVSLHAQSAVDKATPGETSVQNLAASDQKSLDDVYSLARTTNLYGMRADWNETDASVPDIIAEAQKLIGSDDTVIEVRTKDDTRATFALQQATLGGTLCSVAALSNCRVWVFPHRIVLAPESALSAKETEALFNRRAGEWTRTYGWNAQNEIEQVSIRIIIADMKARLATRGQTLPLLPPAVTSTDLGGVPFASYELPFGDLGQTAQRALQLLSDHKYYNDSSYFPIAGPPPLLSSHLHVALDERQYNHLLFIKEINAPKSQFRWMMWNMLQPRPLQSLH